MKLLGSFQESGPPIQTLKSKDLIIKTSTKRTLPIDGNSNFSFSLLCNCALFQLTPPPAPSHLGFISGVLTTAHIPRKAPSSEPDSQVIAARHRLAIGRQLSIMTCSAAEPGYSPLRDDLRLLAELPDGQ